MTNLDSILKSRDIILPTKVRPVEAMDFPSSHVWMWELDYKDSWALKNWCFWIVVLEKTLESPLDNKEIKPVILKEISPDYAIGRTDTKTETLATWCKGLTHWKRPWCWERLEARGEGDNKAWNDWMAPPSWWTWVWASSRNGGVQGSLACCSPWGHK